MKWISGMDALCREKYRLNILAEVQWWRRVNVACWICPAASQQPEQEAAEVWREMSSDREKQMDTYGVFA